MFNLSPVQSLPLFSSMLTLAQADAAIVESADELGSAPYWVLGCYLFILLVLGIFGWLRSKAGEEDYYLASRGQGWIVSSLTIMATFFSSFALLGAPGLVYKEGVTLALFSLNVPVAGVCVYLLGARIWAIGRKMGYVTTGDMVADYYGNSATSRVSLRLLVALAGFLYAIPYVVMQIQAGGLLSQKLFGEESFALGAILLAAITTLYIMIGGMRSVAWTDLIQGLLLISGMLVSGFAMLLLFDGPANFSERVVTELPTSSLTIPGNSGGWPWAMLFTVCVLGSSGSMVQPAQWMRYYSARNVQTLKRGAVIFAAVLTTCFIVGVMLIGMAGQVLYPLHKGFALNFDVAGMNGDSLQLSPQDVPESMRPYFHYVPPSDNSLNPVGTVVWSWPLRDERPAIHEDDVATLKHLKNNPAWIAAIDKIQEQVADSTAKPILIPNPAVDPDPTHGQDFDSILVVVLQKQLPKLLGGFGAAFASLIIVAIMAASMSTADSNLHALSAVLTRDVYDQYVHPSATETERVWIGRLIIVLATVLALVVVIKGRDPAIAAKYEFLNMIAKMGLMAVAFSSQLLPLTIDMLFLNKGTGKGAAAGLGAGLLVVFLFGPLFQMLVQDVAGSPPALESVLNIINGLKFEKMHGSVWGLAVNIPVFVVVSWLTEKPDQRKVEQFRESFSSI